MRDETKGLKTNRVMLNLGQHGSLEPPEPGIAAVIIDGVPIHAVQRIVISAGASEMTLCQIIFECEVSGQIAGTSVQDILRNSEGSS